MRRSGDGLAKDQPRAAGFDLELDQVGSLEQLGEAIDQAEQLGIAAGDGVGGIDRRRIAAGAVSSVIRPTGGR